jgi:uncharacterized membrane protein
MNAGRRTVMDEKLQILLANILRIGIFSSAGLVLAGGIYYLVVNGTAGASFHVFRPEAVKNLDLSGIARNVSAFKSEGLIQLGLLMLIATPILRVLFSLVMFALERDRIYVVVTLIVLGVIFFSLFS